jgi:hypothetical protein
MPGAHTAVNLTRARSSTGCTCRSHVRSPAGHVIGVKTTGARIMLCSCALLAELAGAREKPPACPPARLPLKGLMKTSRLRGRSTHSAAYALIWCCHVWACSSECVLRQCSCSSHLLGVFLAGAYEYTSSRCCPCGGRQSGRRGGQRRRRSTSGDVLALALSAQPARLCSAGIDERVHGWGLQAGRTAVGCRLAGWRAQAAASARCWRGL